MRLAPPLRDGVDVCQRMLTEGSSACVPESSIVVVFACAADAQIMLNAQTKKKQARDTSGSRPLWRAQRVQDNAGKGAGGRHSVVRIGERQAAFIPAIAAHGADVLHGAVGKGAGRKRLGAGIGVAARGPADF